MTPQQRQAAAEERARRREAGNRELARLRIIHPIGSYVYVAELLEVVRVTGHELNTVYVPLVETTHGVFYGYEVETREEETAR